MKKIGTNILILLIMTTLLFCLGCKGSDDPETPDEDSKPDSGEEPDSEVPDKGDSMIKDCNYSSTDNRLTPKSDVMQFSGQIFGESSLTRFTYIMNRCYNCDGSDPLVISDMFIIDEFGNKDSGDFTLQVNPVENGPVSLKNDEEIGIGVSFFANTWEEHIRYLRIKSNDKCRPLFDIKLSGQTKSTGMIVVKTIDDDDPDDDMMIFGEVKEEVTNSLEIHNVGTATLSIFSMSVSSGRSNSSNEPGFFISEGPEPGTKISPDGQ
ncbi:MAG TPA: hypothetical protein ENN58_02340, partial [bacterium]|nr:hypothetical protein [bacterium]